MVWLVVEDVVFVRRVCVCVGLPTSLVFDELSVVVTASWLMQFCSETACAGPIGMLVLFYMLKLDALLCG